MSDDFDPLTTENAVKPISNRGILIAMLIIIVAGSVAGFIFGGRLWGVGVIFGGGLAFVNYLWLERSTRAIFDQAAIATTSILAAKYILRYVAIGLVLLLIYLTGAFPLAAVILGLSAFAFAVVVQGLKNIISGSI